jgi:hypothetical protein
LGDQRLIADAVNAVVGYHYLEVLPVVPYPLVAVEGVHAVPHLRSKRMDIRNDQKKGGYYSIHGDVLIC